MPPTTEELLTQLAHPWGELSWAAARELARLGERRAVEPLLAMLEACVTSTEADPASTAEDRRCWGVASALAVFREPRAFDGLLRLVRHGQRGTQQYAARALGTFGDPRARPVLWEVLASRPGSTVVSFGGGVRHAILGALAELHDSGAIPLLIQEFEHADQNNVAAQAARSVATFGEAAFTPLSEAARSPDPRVRMWALVAMETSADPRVVEPLLRALADEAALVRRQAARILGELGDRRAVAPLQSLTDDPDAELRKQVASSLRKLHARTGPLLPKPGPRRHVLNIYADYHQFYLGDSTFTADTASPQFWSDEALALKLAVAPPSLIGVATTRYDVVPVVIELLEAPPADDPQQWDHVVEASLALPSGRLAIDGCTSYRPDSSPHLEVSPGTYRVRICYAGQDTLDEDWYRIALWPQAPYAPARLLHSI